jgi:hypothetical protein
LHIPEKSIAVFREGWRVICGRSPSILIRWTNGKVWGPLMKSKVSVFSVYYLRSGPIDASYSSILPRFFRKNRLEHFRI